MYPSYMTAGRIVWGISVSVVTALCLVPGVSCASDEHANRALRRLDLPADPPVAECAKMLTDDLLQDFRFREWKDKFSTQHPKWAEGGIAMALAEVDNRADDYRWVSWMRDFTQELSTQLKVQGVTLVDRSSGVAGTPTPVSPEPPAIMLKLRITTHLETDRSLDSQGESEPGTPARRECVLRAEMVDMATKFVITSVRMTIEEELRPPGRP